eukprot:TRINITY_DN43971_c0_g1_i1.p1 TRINITY_DN43971_c0_g1~~TRINITY_DN43971_c0_g1_i1.p1  ORF type:complete len:476 (-),score=54.18 TRINITY_DN43971_c0_g1_i1:341-1768(-)
MVAIDVGRLNKQEWENGLLDAGLQCPICMEFFCAPLLLECGHAFCRLCLLQSARLAPDGRRCPECRAFIQLKDPVSHPTDAVLEKRLRVVVPEDALAKRLAAHDLQLAEFLERSRQQFPIFFMKGVASRPGQAVRLHLFEPRYRILIRRAWEGNRLFVCTQRAPREGDTGLAVHVESASFLSDGKADIRGYGVERVTLGRVWVEECSEGLYYAEVGAPVVVRQRTSRNTRPPSTRSEPSSRGSGSSTNGDSIPHNPRLHAKAGLRSVIDAGAPVFNRGSHRECVELYLRAAADISSQAISDSDVVAILQRGLSEAADAMHRDDVTSAAWKLRRSFDEVLALPLRSVPSSDTFDDGELAEDQELPIFSVSFGASVGWTLRMRFFEPRYRLLAQEVWEAPDRLFLFAEDVPRIGGKATLVRLQECEWDTSGNAHVDVFGVKAVYLREVRIDPEKEGLYYGTFGTSPSVVEPRCCVVQ